MTNKTDKIKKLLGELVELLTEKEVDTTSVVVTIPTTITVKSHDEPEKMTWYEAMDKFGPNGTDKVCRLPTKDELSFMCHVKDNIPNLDPNAWYWSSSENNNNNYSWLERFSDGYETNISKNYGCFVRCLRR